MSGDQPHTPIEAAHALTWRDAKCPGDWTPVERHFRAGHTETWWAADARLRAVPKWLCETRLLRSALHVVSW